MDLTKLFGIQKSWSLVSNANVNITKQSLIYAGFLNSNFVWFRHQKIYDRFQNPPSAPYYFQIAEVKNSMSHLLVAFLGYGRDKFGRFIIVLAVRTGLPSIHIY